LEQKKNFCTPSLIQQIKKNDGIIWYEAALMNISVRGVEISRYRLRKKLGLDTEENLTEFMMGL